MEVAAFLTDFGLAKSVSTGSKLTRTGVALGTVEYMSPEQARGDSSALTPATDTWAVGILLYEAVAGRVPFEGETSAHVVLRILQREAVPIRRFAPGVPEAVERVVQVSLAKRLAGRYPDGAALRDDLDRVLEGKAPVARAPRRSRAAVAAGLALAAAGIAGAVWGAWPRGGGAAARSPLSPPGPSAAPAPRAPLARADALADRARALRSLDPIEGARLLGEALALEPARHAWRLERGLLLWAVELPGEAREEWGRVPAGAPESGAARFLLSLEAFFGLRPEEARPALEAFSADPGRHGRIARAALAALEGRWEESRREARDETGWEAALLRAYVESGDPAGDPKAALRDYDVGLSDGVPFAWALNGRGLARKRLRDLAGALADFEAALRLRPDFPEAVLNRGLARLRLGDPERAKADFDEALRLRPGYPEGYTARAEAREALGDLRGAVEDHTAALQGRPDLPTALLGRGNCRLRLGDLPGAMDDFGELARLDPGDPMPCNNRGMLRQRMGDLAGAIEDYTEAIRRAPGDPLALNNRGMVRRNLGDTAAAERDFEAAIRSNPSYATPHANLGFLLVDRGDFAGAAERLRTVLRLAPGDPRAEQVRGLLARCERELRSR
ncbi:MAG: tetratricopeptide repeat protein [Planctomycetales bacterium]|nr:tetratricopeptide repeat protein [Planctomycetales bacterium]